MAEVQTEHAKYFEALQQHPRMLVGKTVPSLSGEGQEVLRDAADAKDWQDGVKHLLADEVRSRASKQMDENATFLQTMHSSIELFSNNPDLIPGTKGFDRELADRFVAMVTPYELRNEGKLQGYSIPVQPILEQVRAALVAERAKAGGAAAPAAPETAAAPAAASAPATPAAPAQAAPAQPQAGIPSKAGGAAEEEGFGALWGTLGLPDLRL